MKVHWKRKVLKKLLQKKRKSDSNTKPLPTSVGIPENSKKSKKAKTKHRDDEVQKEPVNSENNKVIDSKDGIVIEKIKKNWCTNLNRSRGGLSKDDFDALSKFGQIQNVKGDGNCKLYAGVEGLLNCLIAFLDWLLM